MSPTLSSYSTQEPVENMMGWKFQWASGRGPDLASAFELIIYVPLNCQPLIFLSTVSPYLLQQKAVRRIRIMHEKAFGYC